MDRFKFRQPVYGKGKFERFHYWGRNTEDGTTFSTPETNNGFKDYKQDEQCTGLKDKNGTFIYEGDILQKFEVYNEIEYHSPFCRDNHIEGELVSGVVKFDGVGFVVEYTEFRVDNRGESTSQPIDWFLATPSDKDHLCNVVGISENNHDSMEYLIDDVICLDDVLYSEINDAKYNDIFESLKVEIIGNIHENPELLEVENEK